MSAKTTNSVDLTGRHIRLGWIALLVFACLGIALKRCTASRSAGTSMWQTTLGG